MRWIAPLLAAACLTPLTAAPHTLDWPVDELVPFFADSGVRANPAPTNQAVFVDVVALRDADWLRVYFDDVELADGLHRLGLRLEQLRGLSLGPPFCCAGFQFSVVRSLRSDTRN